MAVTAIIPTWNRRELVSAVVSDLLRQTQPPDRILVVDNGSTDGTVEACERLGATVLRMGRNAGFAAAVNHGIGFTSAEWVVILNNDVQLHPDWLERLVSRAEAGGASFACGKLLQTADHSRMDGSFDLLCRGGCAWRAGQGRESGAIWNQARRIYFVPFTAALFRRDLFDEVGYLDERFESYLEDVDFGLRCANAGREGVYVPDAVAYHMGSATLGAWSARMVRLLSRNQLLLMAKHGALRQNRWPAFVAQSLWGLLAVRHGAGWAWLQGKREGLVLARSMQAETDLSLRGVLEESESQLRYLQQETGPDAFWKLYFRLT